MPRRGRSLLSDHRIFFVTTSTKNHSMLFDTPEILTKLRDLLIEVTDRHKAVLLGYVLMSNHVHLIVWSEKGGPGLCSLMRDFKRLAALRYFPGRSGIWQERFDDVAIFSEDAFRTKLAYIHNDPVKAGIVSVACDYEYSSARAWLKGIDMTGVQTTLEF